MPKLKHLKEFFPAAIALMLITTIGIAIYLQNQPQTLYPEEIREYEGEDLSSISAFRENSIKGPQHVLNATYQLAITGLVNNTLLQTAGIDNRTRVVIFHAYDGYTTSLPLDYLLDKDILIAYKMNGLTLPPERGYPFELVAESKLGYKWIKWITEIELSDDVDYTGFWESRGYPNTADIPGT